MVYQIDDLTYIIGKSPAMQRVHAIIQTVAPTTATVLITGETGSGKEVVARAIHFFSQRRHSPFIVVNCVALPASLIESELFGHEKGAFTGAESTRLGRFETADKGTILLDEISEIEPPFQAKLLRVLEHKTFERVGSSLSKKIDVRIIATSNHNLESLVREGRFREDLYHRLNVIPMHIAPLRARQEDIEPLFNYFLSQYCHKHQKPLKTVQPNAWELLIRCDWPGNVRQLINFVERLVVMVKNDCIKSEDIEEWLTSEGKSVIDSKGGLAGKPLEEIECETIRSTLRQLGNNRRRTAEVLGIAERTLRDKIRRYSILDIKSGV